MNNHSHTNWLDTIPRHWEVKRIKDVFTLGSGLAISKADLIEQGVPVISYGQIHAKFNTGTTVDDRLIRYVSQDYLNTDSSSLVNEGDVIFADTSEDIAGSGNCVYVDKQMQLFAGYHTVILKNKCENPNRFLAYLFQSDDWRAQIRSRVCGVKLFSITKNILQSTAIALPPIAEQERIADYLDSKIADINAYVAQRERELQLLKQLKQARVNEIVTQGLQPNTPMKDSGIPWLGQIPQHWEVRRLKDLGYLYGGLTGKSGDDFRSEDTTTTKPFIPFTNILNNQYVDFSQFKYVVMSDNEDQNRVCENDLLFLMSSEDYESIAKVAMVKGDPGEVYLNSFCKGFRITDKDVYCPFLTYQLSGDAYHDALRIEAQGFTRINIKTGKIASAFIALPPLDEQRAIVEYLDHECEQIEKKCTLIDEQIRQLQLLKRSLINEVVTGKRQV